MKYVGILQKKVIVSVVELNLMHRRAIGLDEGALASLYRPLALLLSYVCN